MFPLYLNIPMCCFLSIVCISCVSRKRYLHGNFISVVQAVMQKTRMHTDNLHNKHTEIYKTFKRSKRPEKHFECYLIENKLVC